MDGTSSVIIVVVFVLTILSGFGSNKGYHPPVVTTSSEPGLTVEAEPLVKPPVMPQSVQANYVEGQKRPIANFITSFRKPDQAVAIAESIELHSKKYDVNPKLIAALMRRESGFNPRALSSSGAVGLGQLLPSTCKTTGVTNPYEIDDNTRGTVRYVRYLLDKFKGFSDPVCFALAGYLEGPNGVYRNRAIKAKTATYVSDILAIYNRI